MTRTRYMMPNAPATARRELAKLAAREFTVELSFPDPALMQNRSTGRHWTYTHGEKTAQRQEAYLLTRQAMTAAGFYADAGAAYRIEMEFIPSDKRRRDVSNLHAACKAALDGIAEAMGVDDFQFKDHHQRMGAMQYRARVVVKVSEIR
jgi:crossover junction endodeoxyribonuclease RusA